LTAATLICRLPAIADLANFENRSRLIRIASAAILLTAAIGCATSKPLPPIAEDQIGSAPPPTVTTPLPPARPSSPEAVPFAIAAGPDGNLWYTDFRHSRISRITLEGHVTIFPLKPDGLAERLTAGADHAIWFTDPAANRIGRLALNGAEDYVPLPTPDSGPASIVLGPGNDLWFTEHAANRIGKVTPLV
jgi:streptogramin lyase